MFTISFVSFSEKERHFALSDYIHLPVVPGNISFDDVSRSFVGTCSRNI